MASNEATVSTITVDGKAVTLGARASCPHHRRRNENVHRPKGYEPFSAGREESATPRYWGDRQEDTACCFGSIQSLG